MTSQCLHLQEALGRHCRNCCSADSRVSEVECQLKTLEQTLQNERQICDGHRKYIDELESNLNTVADDVTKQVFQCRLSLCYYYLR